MPTSTLSGTMPAMGAPRAQGISSLGNLSGQVAMKQQAGQQPALDRLKLGKHCVHFMCVGMRP